MEARTGSTAEDALNEQGVSDLERGQINTLGLTPESIVKWLGEKGYEAKDLGDDNYAVRKPGSLWRKVDPSGAGDWWRDLTIDAADELASLGAMAKGGSMGAAAGSALGGVGGLVGGLAGASAGAAGAEAARRLAGKAAGFEEGAGDFGRGVGHEALWGAAGELGGKALGYVAGKVLGSGSRAAKALKAPLQRERAKTMLGQEITREQDLRAAVREADAAMVPAQEEIRQAKGRLSAAAVERQEAGIEQRAALRERAAKAEQGSAEAIARGKAEAEGMSWEPSPAVNITRTQGEAMSRTGRRGWDIPSEIARPDWGIRADAIRANPEVGAILRKHFGDEFVPVGAAEEGAVATGSHAMLQREARLRRLMRERGPEWAADASRGFVRDISAYMLGHPEFRAQIDPSLFRVLAEGARGAESPEAGRVVWETLTSRLQGRRVTPRLRAAQDAYEREQLAVRVLQSGALRSAEAQTLAEAQGVLRSQRARTARARARHSALNPKAPYADFGATWLGGRVVPPAVVRPVEWAARRIGYGAGRALEGAARPPDWVLRGAAQAGTLPRRRRR